MSDLGTGAALPLMPEPAETAGRVSQPRRRLSVVRVFLGIVLVVALSSGGYLGLQWWGSAQAAEAYNPWFAGYVDVTATPTYDFEASTAQAGSDVELVTGPFVKPAAPKRAKQGAFK